MIAPVYAVLVFAVQQGGVTINVGGGRPDTTVSVVGDSAYRARVARDSVRAARRRAEPVTATERDVATAFADPGARAMLERARQARLSQDSALLGYDATAYERFTIGLALSRIARQRVFLRYERSARIRWTRDGGARVEITGERTTAPLLGDDADMDLGDLPPLPYFPGREPLWGAMLARANVSEDEIINPLASGAEKYYTYASGDVATFRLPGGQEISIREIRARPRTPTWKVLVASLWVDAATGRLVRGAYRMAEQMDIMAVAREEGDDDGCEPRWVCAALQPMIANVPVVTVEYGLHEGRFWLPRTQIIEGYARAGVMRAPFKLEQTYRYESVNGSVPIAPVSVTVADTATDSLSRARRARVRRARCAPTEFRERTVLRYERSLPVSIRVSCDTAALARSPTLPPSALDESEEIFGSAQRDELIQRALDLGAQAQFAPGRVRFEHPIQTTRYNRIEGLSTGIVAVQSLGAGLTARGELRFGFADRQVNGSLGAVRSNGRTDVGMSAYRRLAAADDWGTPFSLSASLGALVSGRDDFFYFRTAGVELTRGPTERAGLTTRLFVERHDSARTEAMGSLARVINDRRFRANIGAEEGTVVGAALRWTGSRGLDPRGFRALTDVRVEGAAGAFDYGRLAADVTLSDAFGPLGAALTVAGGTSLGGLPVQRWWFLGGAHTVRGQTPGVARGDAFWLARAEVGGSLPLVRPVVFADLGWAGDRARFDEPGRPISGAGVGASVLDGMLRFDIAKGIRPVSALRGYLYLEARL